PFAAAINYPLTNVASDPGIIATPQAIATEDFNGDGKLDLLVGGTGTHGGPGLVFLPGDSDGTFGAPVSSAATSTFTSIAVGDFDGDGKLDVAALNRNVSPSTVSILLGDGDGTFHPEAESYDVGQGADTVIAADLNGDDKVDLVTSNDQDNDVTVLLGNGA